MNTPELFNQSAAPSNGVIALPHSRVSCRHLVLCMHGSNDAFRRFCTSYSAVQTWILRSPRPDLQTIENSRPEVEPPTVILDRTYVCFQCFIICTDQTTRGHFQARKHTFFVETRMGFMHCQQCNNFVYASELEKLRAMVRASQYGNRKREIKIVSLRPVQGQVTFPRGLFNLGQTCYLNVILQAFTHHPMLSSYFLANRHNQRNCVVDQCIACALNDLLRQMLTTTNRGAYAPVQFLSSSWINMPSLASDIQHDAHEFFLCLVDSLHDCMDSQNLKRIDRCSCIAHQSFTSCFYKTVTCTECWHMVPSSEAFIDISLHLAQGILSGPKRDGFPEKNPPPASNLLRCLEKFTSPEPIDCHPEGRICGFECCYSYCCKQPSNIRRRTQFLRLPPTLCFHTKRYTFQDGVATKFNGEFQFPLELDVSPYMAPPEVIALHNRPAPAGRWYDLMSVVFHEGNMESGHYKTCCQRDGIWLLFNDNQVTLASQWEVMDTSAYMLFYVRRGLSGEPGSEPGSAWWRY